MVFEKTKEIIIDQLGVPEDAITMDTDLMKDLEADSLDAVEIIVAMEEEFGTVVPDDEIENFKTVGDIVRYIEERTEE